MRELLRRIEKEEKEGARSFNDLSEKLRKDLERDVQPEIIEDGLEAIKGFLRQF